MIQQRSEQKLAAVMQSADRLIESEGVERARLFVRDAASRFVRCGEPEQAFRLLSAVRIVDDPDDEILTRLRSTLFRYEMTRVRRLRRRLLYVLAAVLGYLFVVSPTVFVALENPYRLAHMLSELDWSEGLYWSVITSTTIGYGDLVPFTPFGRMFALFNALLGVLLMGVVAGLILSAVTPRRLD